MFPGDLVELTHSWLEFYMVKTSPSQGVMPESNKCSLLFTGDGYFAHSGKELSNSPIKQSPLPPLQIISNQLKA